MALDAGKLALLDWKVTAYEDRKYKTLAELATALGIGERTIYRWLNSQDFKAAFTDAVLAYSEDQLAGSINSLFRYANEPNGYHDRKTIVHDLLPHIRKARDEHRFEKLVPAGVTGVTRDQAFEKLRNYSEEDQEKFYNLLVELGKVQGQEPADDDSPVFSVRKDQEAPLPQLPASPGRPRGSRKVRLKRAAEDA